MARYLDVHPDNPQPRLLNQVADALRDDALIAYPTDSGYALGCRLGNRDGRDRILRIRGLDDKHHFTLMCKDFAQLGQFVHVDNSAFRAIKAATPGPYTFILPATPEVPRRLLHPKKRTVGVRIPDHTVVQALLETFGEPLLTSTLILPGEDEPRTSGWEIKEELDHQVDIVVEAGETSADAHDRGRPVGGCPEIVRYGAGDASRFEVCLAGDRDLVPDRQAGQAEQVADDESATVVGEPGHHGLDDTVARVRDHVGTGQAEQHEDADHQQRRQHADGEEVAGADHQGEAHTQGDEAEVEEQADPADQRQVDDHDRECKRDSERHDLSAGLTPLFPEGSSLGHAYR